MSYNQQLLELLGQAGRTDEFDRPLRTRKPRRRHPRRASVRSIIKQARAAGATAVTTPDGFVLSLADTAPQEDQLTPEQELAKWSASRAH